MNRKTVIISSILILVMLYSSILAQPVFSNTNNANQQTTTSTIYYSSTTSTTYPPVTTTSAGGSLIGLTQGLPLGTGSMNFSFVVGNSLTTNNGPTNLTGTQAGKTIFYDINVNSLPLNNLIKTLYPSASGLIESFGTQNSKIFFKIITDQGDYIQFVPGFILGDNILFNSSLLFNSNSTALPDLLSSILVPSPLTISLPSDNIFMADPIANQTGPNCYNYNYYYYYNSEGYPSCPTVSSPNMNLYLNANFTQHKQEFDKYDSNFYQYANYTQLSYLNWNQYSSNYLPPNVQRQLESTYCYNITNTQTYCYTNYAYYEQNLIVHNNSVNLSMPYSYVYNAYYQNQFNPTINPITNQQYGSLPINGSYYYSSNRTRQLNFTNVPDNSKVAVIFQPSYNVYATNQQVTIPTNSTTSTIDISSVAGVYNSFTFNYSKPLDQQSGINYYTGGNFSGDTITLGTDPGPLSLVVFYRNATQPYYMYNNILNSTTFVTSVAFHSSANPMEDIGYSVTYNRNDPVTNGWANEIDIYAKIDLNNDGVYLNNEKLDISLTYNASLTYQVNNPLSAGDQGVYNIKESNLKATLSPEYSYFYSQITGSSITDLVNTVNSLSGKKLYDYTITSTDGLLAFFTGNSYNPTLSVNDPSAKTPLNMGNAFSTYDGAFYSNMTTSNASMNSLYSFYNYAYNYGSTNLTQYWLKNYGSNVNATSSLDGYYILENTTLTNNYAPISLPTYGTVTFYRTSDYNFSLTPYNQNATSYYGNIYQNYTDNSFYLNTYNSYFIGSQNIIVVYQPSSNLYAINGKVVLPYALKNINGIYLNSYYNGTNNNLLADTTINGSVLTIHNIPNFVQVSINYAQANWNGQKVYARLAPYNSLETYNQITGLFGFTPARSRDFFITQNNDQAFNTFTTDKLSPLLQYIENSINDIPNNGFFGNISLKGNLNFSFLTNANNDKTSMMNGSVNLFLPLKISSYNLPVSIQQDFYLSGTFGAWTTWQSSGILKEFGVTINVQLKTTSLNQSILSSSSTQFTKTSPTTVTTSDGFMLQSFLLVTLVALPIIYHRRKTNK